jgi:lysosomal acid lipase/cholesteryl ester hydrolase
MLEWFWNDPSQANAFILANAGYDVWMGNNRGSKYSHGHLTLSPHDHAYWDYYQEDMARYDLPAFINFVTATTAQPKISYIGHSEGTT